MTEVRVCPGWKGMVSSPYGPRKSSCGPEPRVLREGKELCAKCQRTADKKAGDASVAEKEGKRIWDHHVEEAELAVSKLGGPLSTGNNIDINDFIVELERRIAGSYQAGKRWAVLRVFLGLPAYSDEEGEVQFMGPARRSRRVW